MTQFTLRYPPLTFDSPASHVCPFLSICARGHTEKLPILKSVMTEGGFQGGEDALRGAAFRSPWQGTAPRATVGAPGLPRPTARSREQRACAAGASRRRPGLTGGAVARWAAGTGRAIRVVVLGRGRTGHLGGVPRSASAAPGLRRGGGVGPRTGPKDSGGVRRGFGSAVEARQRPAKSNTLKAAPCSRRRSEGPSAGGSPLLRAAGRLGRQCYRSVASGWLVEAFSVKGTSMIPSSPVMHVDAQEASQDGAAHLDVARVLIQQVHVVRLTQDSEDLEGQFLR